MSNQYALSNAPIVSLMKNATFEGELADESLYGMALEILEENGPWKRVRTPYRYESWAHESQLLNVQQDHAYLTRGLATVTRPFADVMHGPDVTSYALINLPKGAKVLPLQDEGSWTKVQLLDGRQGYIRSSYIIPIVPKSDEDGKRDQLASIALSFLGAPYRWGGKTMQGIDCSGLCSLAYLLMGYTIYRDASVLPGFDMHKIPYEDVKKGDLLFFKGHVAMALGDGRIVHSTGRAGDDGVVINSLIPSLPDYRKDLSEGILYCGSVF